MSYSRAARSALLLALVPILFYWKLVFNDQYSWLESPDLAHQVLPWFQYQAGEWHKGRFPAWAPFEFAGQPLVGQTQPGSVYPFNWLLFLAPLKRGWLRFDVLNAYFIGIHILALGSAYALCRDLGVSRLAAIVGGMIFSFGGYLGSTDWPQMLNGAIWGPLIFKYHLRWRARREELRSAVLAGFFAGIAWLSGHHQIPIFLSLALAISTVEHLWKSSDDRRRRLATAALPFGILFLVGAAQLLPAYEYGRLAVRWVGLDDPVDWRQKVPYFLHQQWGLIPLSIVGFIIPGFNYNSSPFIGIAAATLVTLGASRSRYFLALGGLALAYSLAEYSPVEGVLYSFFPMVDKARSPGMATAVIAIAVAAVAALGADRLREAFPAVTARKVLLWFGGGLLAVMVLLALVKGLAGISDQRPVMTALFALAAAGILSLTPERRPMAFAALIFWELSLSATYYLPNRFDKAPTRFTPRLSQHAEIVEFLRQDPEPPRVSLDPAIQQNFGDWFGVDVFGSYLASITKNLNDTEFTSTRAQRLFGVKYWIGRSPAEFTGPAVFSGAGGWNVYPVTDSLEIARIVHAVFPADTAQQAAEMTRNPAIDLRNAAVVVRPDFQLERCRGSHASVLRREAGRVVVGAEAACRGLLTVAEVDFPGWTVIVDGRYARHWTVNGAQQGVVLEPGWHAVEFRYQPKMLYAGGVLTILGTLAALAASIIGRERS